MHGRRRQRAGDGRRRDRRMRGDRAGRAARRARRAARALARVRRCGPAAFRDPRADPRAGASRYAGVPLRGRALRRDRERERLDGGETADPLRNGRVPGARVRDGGAGAVRLGAARAALAAGTGPGRHAAAGRRRGSRVT
ncbi:protein of unknown function [Burkholderia multivorans]